MCVCGVSLFVGDFQRFEHAQHSIVPQPYVFLESLSS